MTPPELHDLCPFPQTGGEHRVHQGRRLDCGWPVASRGGAAGMPLLGQGQGAVWASVAMRSWVKVPYLAGLDSDKPWLSRRPEDVRRGSCRQANVPSTHREGPPSAALLLSPEGLHVPQPGILTPPWNLSLQVLQRSSFKTTLFSKHPLPCPRLLAVPSPVHPPGFNRDIASARNPPCLGPSHLQASLGPWGCTDCDFASGLVSWLAFPWAPFPVYLLQESPAHQLHMFKGQ